MPKVRTGKKPEEPPRGTPAYMVTYGDMCTLMLTFFIFMFSPFTKPSDARINAAISSFRVAMGVFPGSISVLRPDEALLIPKEKGTKNGWGEKQKVADLEKVIREKMKEMSKMKPGDFTIDVGKREMKITIGSQALFDPGSAEVKNEFKSALDKIGQFIKDNKLQVVVEGHTDSLPISSALFPSNWELSVGRASRVIRYLNDKYGIPEKNLSASGYADTRPIADNATAEGRMKNRRIEITLKPTKDSPAGSDRAAQDLFNGETF